MAFDGRQLDVITGAASIEPCCLPGMCAFSEQAIGFYRILRQRCLDAGEDPMEAAYSLLHAGSDHQAFASIMRATAPGPGESVQLQWAARMVDVERAEQAGCVTDLQVSGFLCSFGAVEETPLAFPAVALPAVHREAS